MVDKELLELLLRADKSHIDELVDIVANSGKGRFALNSTVKDLFIDMKKNNTKYSEDTLELLIAEFQSYADNTIKKPFRKKALTYNQILNDVYLKLGGRSPEKNIQQKEEEILVGLLGQEYQDKDFSERFEASASKKIQPTSDENRIKKTFKNANGSVGTAAGGAAGAAGAGAVVSVVATGAAAGGAVVSVVATGAAAPVVITAAAVNLVYEAFSAAYRIIIPFVVQIAWLKRKYHFNNKKDVMSSPNINPKKLELVNEQQQSVISFEGGAGEYLEKNGGETIDNESISKFNQLLSSVPNLMTALELKNGSYLICNLDSSLLTKAADGNGLRGMVRNTKGISEHARFDDPKKLHSIVRTGVLFNLASTIVAQKHLADISRKLDEIQEGIDDIKSFLNDQRAAVVESAIEDLANNISFIRSGESLDAGKITSIDNNIVVHINPILISFAKEIDRNTEKLKNIVNGKNIFDTTDQIRVKIIKILNNRRILLNRYKTVGSVMLNTYMIIQDQSDDLSIKKRFKQSFNNKRKQMKQDVEKFYADIKPLVEKSIKSMDTVLSSGNTIKANQIMIDNRRLELKSIYQESINNYANLNQLFSPTKLSRVALMVEDGEVKKGHILLEENTAVPA